MATKAEFSEGLKKTGKHATICFLVRTVRGRITEVCLAMKKRGFGEGKWNGAGGKVGDKPEHKDETVEEGAKREILEELGVEATQMQEVAQLEYHPTDKPHFTTGHVFLVHKWKGEPSQSEEMRPQWFPVTALPLQEMWVTDREWLPPVLEGKKVHAKYVFDDSETLLEHSLEVIDN